MRRASHEHKSLRGQCKRRWPAAAACGLSCAMASSTYGVVRRVDTTAAIGGNGASWPTAFKHLNDAIAVAVSGDEIWVAQGTYRPDQIDLFPGGTNIRSATFSLVDGVKLYAGFPTGGGNNTFQARNPELYITTLSGDIGVPVDYLDNSLHVVTAQDVTATAKLNGFWIRDGNADSGTGGGIYICNAQPQIVRCTFDSNRAGNGGAVGSSAAGTCVGSTPVFVNCSFVKNVAAAAGGAMYLSGVRPFTGHNCVFDSNTAGGQGGAMFVGCGFESSTVILRNCTFTRNAAAQGGGAMAWGTSCTTSDIVNCIFWGDLPANNEIQVANSATAGITYSDVQQLSGTWPGAGTNINAPPMFVDILVDNLRLRNVCPLVSPCIDAGSDAAVPVDLADLDNDGSSTEQLPWDRDKDTPTTVSHWGRVFDVAAGPGTKVDMGAYESQHIKRLRWDIASNLQGPPPDDAVNINDFLMLLSDWSPTGVPACAGCGADFDYDSQVGITDWLQLLANWCSSTTTPPCIYCKTNGQGPSPVVDGALAVMGFSGLDEYGAWLEQASAEEAYASAVTLALLLGG